MTKKYYYDCPIQAAYMAKEFGITIHGKATKSGHKYPISSDWNSVINFRCGKMYADEELEHVFEPKEGDYVAIKHETWGKLPGRINQYDKKSGWVEISTLGYLYCSGSYDVIMRDNKHFFMPKIETDQK